MVVSDSGDQKIPAALLRTIGDLAFVCKKRHIDIGRRRIFLQQILPSRANGSFGGIIFDTSGLADMGADDP